MPQRWTCACGQQVRFSQLFCGQCGKRWQKNMTPNPKARGKPSSDTKPRVEGFSIPSVVLSSSSAPSGFSNAPQGNGGNPQKSIKSLLHQKANRIGKLEARASKLKAALLQVQESWPKYVHEVQSMLAAEHTKCVQFTNSATAELNQVQHELHELTQPHMHAHQTQADMSQTHMESMQMLQVQQALQLLQSAGLVKLPTYAPQPAQMDVDPPIEPPAVATPVSNPPQLPAVAQAAGIGSNMGNQPANGSIDNADQPPGNWGWPPAAPITCTHVLPDISIDPEESHVEEYVQSGSTGMHPGPLPVVQDMFPNPLYTPPASQPVLPVPVQQVVIQAEAGLRELAQAQGMTPTDALPAHLQQQLDAFKEQQMQCHAQLEAFQQIAAQQARATPIPESPTGHPMSPAPTPVPAMDSLSVKSSPQKHSHAPTSKLEPFPNPQCHQKVAKQTPGNIHAQPQMFSMALGHTAQATNTEDEDQSSRDPTPVPTEIPSDSDDAEGKQAVRTPGALQQLE